MEEKHRPRKEENGELLSLLKIFGAMMNQAASEASKFQDKVHQDIYECTVKLHWIHEKKVLDRMAVEEPSKCGYLKGSIEGTDGARKVAYRAFFDAGKDVVQMAAELGGEDRIKKVKGILESQDGKLDAKLSSKLEELQGEFDRLKCKP